MLLPVAGLALAALGGGAYVCTKGVTVQSGTRAGIPWRVRFACWRYIAEINLAGTWRRAGIFPLGQKQNALQLALSAADVEAFTPQTMAATAEPMVRIMGKKL